MRESEKNRLEALGEEPENKTPLLEKNDMLAMVLSGFLTIGIPCLILIVIIIGACLLLFGGR